MSGYPNSLPTSNIISGIPEQFNKIEELEGNIRFNTNKKKLQIYTDLSWCDIVNYIDNSYITIDGSLNRNNNILLQINDANAAAGASSNGQTIANNVNVNCQDFSVNRIQNNYTDYLNVLSDICFNKNIYVKGNILVDGSFNLNNIIYNEYITDVSYIKINSSLVEISNNGTGHSLKVIQNGNTNKSIALFMKQDISAVEIHNNGKTTFYKEVTFHDKLTIGKTTHVEKIQNLKNFDPLKIHSNIKIADNSSLPKIIDVSENITANNIFTGDVSGNNKSYLLSGNWTLDPSGTDAWLITGTGGLDKSTNPDLSMCRGHTYLFSNNSSYGGHVFGFTTINDVSYTKGVELVGSNPNNDATAGGQHKLLFTVPYDAPDQIKYKCFAHVNNMVGNIYIYDNEVNNTGILYNDGTKNIVINKIKLISGEGMDISFNKQGNNVNVFIKKQAGYVPATLRYGGDAGNMAWYGNANNFNGTQQENWRESIRLALADMTGDLSFGKPALYKARSVKQARDIHSNNYPNDQTKDDNDTNYVCPFVGDHEEPIMVMKNLGDISSSIIIRAGKKLSLSSDQGQSDPSYYGSNVNKKNPYNMYAGANYYSPEGHPSEDGYCATPIIVRNPLLFVEDAIIPSDVMHADSDPVDYVNSYHHTSGTHGNLSYEWGHIDSEKTMAPRNMQGGADASLNQSLWNRLSGSAYAQYKGYTQSKTCIDNLDGGNTNTGIKNTTQIWTSIDPRHNNGEGILMGGQTFREYDWDIINNGSENDLWYNEGITIAGSQENNEGSGGGSGGGGSGGGGY